MEAKTKGRRKKKSNLINGKVEKARSENEGRKMLTSFQWMCWRGDGKNFMENQRSLIRYKRQGKGTE